MLNPHVFPLVAHPGPAPELAARSGQGGWDPYALAAPADRLLPFVLTRLLAPGQGRWVNCAMIVHADTEAIIETLLPTGQTPGGPGPLGLVLDKVVDAANLREYFIYYGALIPGLQLPCGVPLRLLLDNGWQSPRFEAVAELSGAPDGVSARYQRLEWRHPGPLSGVPYGTGLTQRLYVENGGLQYLAPREVAQSSQDASTGLVRANFIAEFARRTTTVGAIPRYLADALAGTRPHKSFFVDNQRWLVQEVKEQVLGSDGGRWTTTLTLEDVEPLQSRPLLPAAPLAPVTFDPLADAPRAWHCGDTSDTAPDYQPTGVTTCELDADLRQTGYALSETEDSNPYSPTVGQPGPVTRTLDLMACPLPILYYSAYFYGLATRDNCQPGYDPSTVVFESAAGRFSSYDSAPGAGDGQALADQKAIDYVAAGKQAYANQVGTCTVSGSNGPIYEPVYTAAGCFTCQMVNQQDPLDIRQATLAETRTYSTPRGIYGTGNCAMCGDAATPSP